MQKDHFKMTISGDNHADMTAIKLLIDGCRNCLQTAIVTLLVRDPEFRALINQCGRDANKIREQQRNGDGPDPSKN